MYAPIKEVLRILQTLCILLHLSEGYHDKKITLLTMFINFLNILPKLPP